LNNVLVPLFIFGLFAGAVWWHARTKVRSDAGLAPLAHDEDAGARLPRRGRRAVGYC
jgi:hypothetical protein